MKDCPRCSVTNAIETKYCSKCSYPLTPEAYGDIKAQEGKILQELHQQLARIQEENDKRYLHVMSLIRQNPVLLNVKPEELARLVPKPAGREEEMME